MLLQSSFYGLQEPSHGQPSFIEQIFYEFLESEILIAIVSLFLLLLIVSLFARRKKELFSHWNVLINQLNYSTGGIKLFLRASFYSWECSLDAVC